MGRSVAAFPHAEGKEGNFNLKGWANYCCCIHVRGVENISGVQASEDPLLGSYYHPRDWLNHDSAGGYTTVQLEARLPLVSTDEQSYRPSHISCHLCCSPVSLYLFPVTDRHTLTAVRKLAWQRPSSTCTFSSSYTDSPEWLLDWKKTNQNKTTKTHKKPQTQQQQQNYNNKNTPPHNLLHIVHMGTYPSQCRQKPTSSIFPRQQAPYCRS